MSRNGHKRVCIVVTLAILAMNFGLWSSQRTPLAHAIPCGVSCENITNTPTVAVTLNGVDQTVSYTLAFSVNNLSALGWNVTITSTQFATGATPMRTLPTTTSFVTAVTAVCTAGQICTALPHNVVVYPLTVPAGNPAPPPVKLYSDQSNTGIGTFDLSATITVTVPANTYAGTYTGTITLAYVIGP